MLLRPLETEPGTPEPNTCLGVAPLNFYDDHKLGHRSHSRVVVDIYWDAEQIAGGLHSGVSSPKTNLPTDLHKRKNPIGTAPAGDVWVCANLHGRGSFDRAV